MSIDSRHIVEQRSRAERTANAEVIPVPDPAPDAAYAGTESEESDARVSRSYLPSAVPGTPLRCLPARPARRYNRRFPSRSRPIPSRSLRSSRRSDPVRRTQASGNGNGAASAGQPDEAGRVAPPAAPDHTAVRLRGAAGRCRWHQADDDRERHDHSPVRRPAHLDRAGHQGPGDRCVDRTDQLSRRQYGAATAGLGRGAADRRSVPPGEPEGDRHLQRRHRLPTHAHLQLRAGRVP